MSAIKDGRFPIMLDKERHLLFSLNAIDEMQDKFGGFDRLDTVLSGKDSVMRHTSASLQRRSVTPI